MERKDKVFIPGELYQIKEENYRNVDSIVVLSQLYNSNCFLLPNNAICLFIGIIKGEFNEEYCKFIHANKIFYSGLDFAKKYWKIKLIC